MASGEILTTYSNEIQQEIKQFARISDNEIGTNCTWSSSKIFNSTNKYRLSKYINVDTKIIKDNIYDVTSIVDNMMNDNNNCKIIIDVNAYMSHPIELKSNIDISAEAGYILYFEGGDGLHISDSVKNVYIHDIFILGYNVTADDSENWLIDIQGHSDNTKMCNVLLQSGYNGIRVNGWINNYINFKVNFFKGIGVYIDCSDNTFNTFYINGCAKQGLYMTSSNNRIYSFKILSCGKECESAYFSGSRNIICNVEIQDIFKSCAVFDGFNNNIIDINLDGIRTHITSSEVNTMASFVNCSYNIIRMISSKYGSLVNVDCKDDTISLDFQCLSNYITASLLKVSLKDGGAKNTIIQSKKETIEYNIEAIANLTKTYPTVQSTKIYPIACTDITADYEGYFFCFRNSGDVTHSGPRIDFDKTNPQQLFCIAVFTVDTPNSTIFLTDQQEHRSFITVGDDTEKEYCLVTVGAEDSTASSWAFLRQNTAVVVTKIKYFYAFNIKYYNDIINKIIK